jgi:hypothetical protein
MDGSVPDGDKDWLRRGPRDQSGPVERPSNGRFRETWMSLEGRAETLEASGPVLSVRKNPFLDGTPNWKGERGKGF